MDDAIDEMQEDCLKAIGLFELTHVRAGLCGPLADAIVQCAHLIRPGPCHCFANIGQQRGTRLNEDLLTGDPDRGGVGMRSTIAV